MTSRELNVMISSRCQNYDCEEGTFPLEEVRARVATALEELKPFGVQIYTIWYNERHSGGAQTDGYNQCLEQATGEDIVLCLWNGHAGTDRICESEYQAAVESAPKKVRLVQLPKALGIPVGQEFSPDIQPLFQVGNDPDEAVAAACRCVLQATLDLALDGVRSARKSRFESGQSLSWNRLNYVQRHEQMVNTMVRHLRGNGVAFPYEWRGTKVLIVCHAVPDRFTVAEAKSFTGRPQFKDNLLLPQMGDDIVGPVHYIACHRTITEVQAKTMAGMDDVLVVASSFGIYLADRVHKAQFLFLANCRDAASTRARLEEAHRWVRSQELDGLCRRARARKAILRTIQEHLD